MSREVRVQTKNLPAAIRQLMKGLKRADGRSYRPREVEVRFHAGPTVKIASGWSMGAVSFLKQVSEPSDTSWVGSDGEFNGQTTTEYAGPVVTVSDYGSSTRCTLHLPTGLEDGHRFYDAARQWQITLSKGDHGILPVMVDAALEGRSMSDLIMPFPTPREMTA